MQEHAAFIDVFEVVAPLVKSAIAEARCTATRDVGAPRRVECQERYASEYT